MNQSNVTGPIISQIEVNGASLSYARQGQGPPVLFLHGAVADYRMWDQHRAAIADRYTAISYTQRYFGPSPWADDWPPFGVNTHAADLLELIPKLAVGAVHLVAWSYAGHIALEVALKQPALLRSVFIYEPGAPTFVTDPVALETFGADATLMFGPVFEAVHGQGDIIEGVRRLIDGSGRREGYFEGQTQAQQDGQLENAKTMPLQLSQSPPPLISCEQLGILTLPVCIAYGELTRPLFKVVSQAAAQCIPNCRLKVIDGVNHMWPIEDPLKFTAEVTDFLQGS